jgi:hypothetical protein
MHRKHVMACVTCDELARPAVYSGGEPATNA